MSSYTKAPIASYIILNRKAATGHPIFLHIHPPFEYLNLMEISDRTNRSQQANNEGEKTISEDEAILLINVYLH